MTKNISSESCLDVYLLEDLFAILEETFETHHDIYLKKNTPLCVISSEDGIGDAITMVVHTAYHLGESGRPSA